MLLGYLYEEGTVLLRTENDWAALYVIATPRNKVTSRHLFQIPSPRQHKIMGIRKIRIQIMQIGINVFHLAGYSPNLIEHEPLDIFGSIDSISSEKPEDDWDNPIFHSEPETPKPWVEFYRQSAIKGELLTIDDPVFKEHWKEYHSSADEWECPCKEEDKTKWCYCDDAKSSAKCSQ